jgi:hypothetical protein
VKQNSFKNSSYNVDNYKDEDDWDDLDSNKKNTTTLKAAIQISNPDTLKTSTSSTKINTNNYEQKDTSPIQESSSLKLKTATVTNNVNTDSSKKFKKTVQQVQPTSSSLRLSKKIEKNANSPVGDDFFANFGIN